MLKKNHNINAGVDITKSKVVVFLNQGFATQKKWIFERQFSIGRDSTADVCIKEPMVSRFHAFVYLNGGKWWVRDMNSSNGTFIEDKKVTKYPVAEQLKLQLGWEGPTLNLCSENPNSLDTETVIVNLGDIRKDNTLYTNFKNRGRKIVTDKGSTPASRNNNGNNKRLLKKWHTNKGTWRKFKPIVVSAMMSGLLLAGYLFLQQDNGSAESRNGIRIARKQAKTDSIRRTESQKTGTEKDFEGIEAGHQVAQPTEQNQLNNPNNLQQQIIRSRTADIYFRAAEKFFVHHRWQKALEYYQNVSEINPNMPSLIKKIAKAKFELDNQTAIQKAKMHIEKKRYEQGIAVLSNFPKNSEYYQDVQELIANAKKKQKQAEEELRRKEAERQKAEQAQKATDTINEALQHYAEGKTKSSIDILNRVTQSSYSGIPELKKRANTLKKDIGYVQSLNHMADQAYKKGKMDTALGAWKKLIQVDQKLLDNKQGYFLKSVRQKMADEYFARALNAYYIGDFADAYQQNKMALDQKGNYSKALEVENMLKEKSKQLYLEGSILEAYNKEKATENYKLITKICDSDSTYYQKALDKINGK